MTGVPIAGAPPGGHGDASGDLLQRVERQLDDVEAALERLHDGSYGICRSCGDPIPDERLAADATATLCGRCDRATAASPETPEAPASPPAASPDHEAP